MRRPTLAALAVTVALAVAGCDRPATADTATPPAVDDATLAEAEAVLDEAEQILDAVDRELAEDTEG